MPPKGFQKRKGKVGAASTFFSSPSPPTPTPAPSSPDDWAVDNDLTAPSSFSTVALTVRQAAIANEVCRACGLGANVQDVDEIRKVCHLAGAGFSVKYMQERYEAAQRESSPLTTVPSTAAPS